MPISDQNQPSAEGIEAVHPDHAGASLQPIQSREYQGKNSHRIRIGYLLSRYPAISHTFFLKEVIELRKRGLEIQVASINPPDRRIEDLPEIESVEARQTFYVKPSGILKVAFQVIRIALSNPEVAIRGMGAALELGGFDLKSRAYALFYFAEALLVGDWMRRNSLSHLHVHFGGPVATVGMLTSQAWQLPWSITLHGPDEFFDQDAFYLRRKIESAKFVLCISDFCRSQVLRIAPDLSNLRVEVVRLGVDCTTLQPRAIESTPKGSGARPLHLVCTGRMVAAKGHRILLEAITTLVSSGIALTCTLIGDGPERSSLEEQCLRSGIASNVQFLGAKSHQATLEQVAKADVFVLASFAEGLPVALMEAMAFGVPCVSTSIAAIPELIHDGQNSLIVPPSNSAALSNALLRLANSPDLRHKLGLAARETVVNEYNLATNLDRLAEIWTRRQT